MTSGSGPSSRIEPARTNSTPWRTTRHDPAFRARRLDRARNASAFPDDVDRAQLFSWPCSAREPRSRLIPREVPKSAFLMSCNAIAFPPQRRSDVTPLDQLFQMRAAPVCTTAGPADQEFLPASSRARFSSVPSRESHRSSFSSAMARGHEFKKRPCARWNAGPARP